MSEFDLHWLPPNYLKRNTKSTEITEAWEKLQLDIRNNEEMKTYLLCTKHWTLPSWECHLDGPPPQKRNHRGSEKPRKHRDIYRDLHIKTFDTMWKPRHIGSKTLTFEMIEEKKILKIEDMSGNEVYLGWESVLEVWSLESVLRYRLIYSSGSNLKHFYKDVIRAVAEMSGDVKINIYNIINRLSEKSDDVCCMLKVLLFMPKKALFDVQLKRRIQEQEYDADHEAIYGMERYFTVQQCEELRDKYKIGRKVCRKFLKRKTCSQYLVKRISEIGLRRFLDAINKYIKDCSDSYTSSSSDKEEFKTVEQNGEDLKTTEE
ncbi:hypothetical protein FQA39_LY18154 [Lamprigera yunnana]|nr:hypothetical protein FQA39_LY18154 [Lamprigera yunnana]